MAINVGDIFRITDCQTLLGQNVCNILYYTVAVWTGNVTLDDVIDDFIDTFISGVRLQQHPDLTHTEIKVENLTSGLEFLNRNVSIVGANPTATEVAPSMVAFSLTKNPSTRITRPGGMRLAGVWEGAMNGNQSTLSVAEKADITNAMIADLTGGITPDEFVLTPTIVGTLPTGGPDLTRTQTFLTASFNGLTTQNSRKFIDG